FYMDFTGTGNSLNPVHPSVLRLIMDSLRYWAIDCHVDGFRFDLASALAREFYDVDRLSAFFDTIHQDPVLSQVKLIAEPWDVGPGGYQVGNFPILWTDWNYGDDGPQDEPAVNAVRARQVRNFLTTLFLAQGVPMLLGGDEIGRTQRGNNNAYCQDNEISWFDWDLDEQQQRLLEFTRRL